MDDVFYNAALVYNVIAGMVLVAYYWHRKPELLSLEFGMVVWVMLVIVGSVSDNVLLRTLLGPMILTLLIAKHWTEIIKQMKARDSLVVRAVRRLMG